MCVTVSHLSWSPNPGTLSTLSRRRSEGDGRHPRPLSHPAYWRDTLPLLSDQLRLPPPISSNPRCMRKEFLGWGLDSSKSLSGKPTFTSLLLGTRKGQDHWPHFGALLAEQRPCMPSHRRGQSLFFPPSAFSLPSHIPEFPVQGTLHQFPCTSPEQRWF